MTLETVTETFEDVPTLLAASYALAPNVWVPSEIDVVSNDVEYGDAVSVLNRLPSL